MPETTLIGEDLSVHGITHDSRFVTPGVLFACIRGAKFDGHDFAEQAVQSGAAALLVDTDRVPQLRGLAPLLAAQSPRRALPHAAALLAGSPSLHLRMAGITGTNGKTTTTCLTAALMEAAGWTSGTIGTLGSTLRGTPIPSSNTTPESTELQGLLAEMLAGGAEAVAMEVSSHALAQFRTDAVHYDVGVFTNLTQDHLDYHGTLEEYFAAKQKLFVDYASATKKPYTAVINLDDPWGSRLWQTTPKAKLGYAINNTADITAEQVHAEPSRLRFTAKTPLGDIAVALGFGGSFQVYNALAAIGAGIALGISAQQIADGLANARPVAGRFESVPNSRGFSVVVDYAHTPDGLENLLKSAQALHPRRVLIVFGCGGDRDRTKRPIMGAIASTLADIAVVTSDNPRTEDPQQILQDILPGMTGRAQRHVVVDREAAIRCAIEMAEPGDMVLIAGKGHEDYQIIGTTKYPFDDREIARRVLQETER
jgi:UDP-N-acetylmuramoyl-L-alanyl-D-glutamate--2,6-diaminopimelate ligase